MDKNKYDEILDDAGRYGKIHLRSNVEMTETQSEDTQESEEKMQKMRDAVKKTSEELLQKTGYQPKKANELVNIESAADWEDEEIPVKELAYYLGRSGEGDAQLYNRLNKDRLVYVKDWDRFLVWQGNHWAEDKKNIAWQRSLAVAEQYEKLKAHYEELAAVATDAKNKAGLEGEATKVQRRIEKIRTHRGQENVKEQSVKITNPPIILPTDIDRHPYLLACPNGVVNLKTGDFLPGKPKDYLLTSCETLFNEELFKSDNPCPETEAFLLSSMNGDAEMAGYIWRLLGYGLIRERKEHIMPLFWGPNGRNGKDTLIKLVTNVMGKKISGDVPVEIFLMSKYGSNPSGPSPDIMALKGMCYAWINEAEDNQRFAAGKVKKMTGGGLLTARGLQDKEMTTFRQGYLPIMTTNELPRAKAEDNAFWHRIKIVKWELSFVDNPKEAYERKADKDLDSKLEAEKEGVLARIVQASLEYMRDGLKEPEKVKSWTMEKREELDDVKAFLCDCFIIEEHKDNPEEYKTRETAKRVTAVWQLWWKETRGQDAPGYRRLGENLDKHGIPKKLSGGTWRLGIKVNDEWDIRLAEEEDRKARSGKTLINQQLASSN